MTQFVDFIRRIVGLALIVGFYCIGGDLQAGPGLLVSPTRIVFESGERSATMTLINTGDETATYRISFVEMQMTETGQIVEIEGTDEVGFCASQLVRYSPRQVTLEPHRPQVVRLQVRKRAQLTEGEYRSHLLFRIIPPLESLSESEEPSKSKSYSRSIKLRPLFGVAVPIIVRHGLTSADAQLTNINLRNEFSSTDSLVLSMQIRRNGNCSVYGNINVTHLGSDGEEYLVGEIDGVAVYTSTEFRQIEIVLRPPSGLQLNNGRLRVTYTEAGSKRSSARHASTILAESEIALTAQSEVKSLVVEEF